jgi:hypothetical protein
VRNAYPLPRIDDLLDQLNGANWFTALDLASGYYQVPVNLKDRPLTAFTAGSMGLFSFTVLPMGLTNSPATFQAVMNRILGKYVHQFCLVYLDDILIYSKTKEDHVRHVRLVLDELKEAQVLLAPTEMCFRTCRGFVPWSHSRQRRPQAGCQEGGCRHSLARP